MELCIFGLYFGLFTHKDSIWKGKSSDPLNLNYERHFDTTSNLTVSLAESTYYRSLMILDDQTGYRKIQGQVQPCPSEMGRASLFE